VRHLHGVVCTKAEPRPSRELPLVCLSRLEQSTFIQNVLTRTGHENLGIVEDLGEGVTLLKKGDRVVMPFNVADGRCRNCEDGKTAFCTGVNPGFAGGAYGLLACLWKRGVVAD
jgi:threonine dehydrogenase-like Zn-dependent dehydrogenase